MNRLATYCMVLCFLLPIYSLASESGEPSKLELKGFEGQKEEIGAKEKDVDAIELKGFGDQPTRQGESVRVRDYRVNVRPQRLEVPKNRFALDVGYSHIITGTSGYLRNGISYAASYYHFFSPYLGVGAVYNGRNYFRSHNNSKDKLHMHLVGPSFISRLVSGRNQNILNVSLSFGYLYYREKVEESVYNIGKSGYGSTLTFSYDIRLNRTGETFFGLFLNLFSGWVSQDYYHYDYYDNNISAIDIGCGIRF